jgi:hypothetical protein
MSRKRRQITIYKPAPPAPVPAAPPAWHTLLSAAGEILCIGLVLCGLVGVVRWVDRVNRPIQVSSAMT